MSVFESSQDIVIRVRGLRNQFGTHVVHEDLDLDVYRGEILGVAGLIGRPMLRLAGASDSADVDRLQAETEDRFGRLPAAGKSLFDMGRLRVLAEQAGVKTIDLVEETEADGSRWGVRVELRFPER